jgi:hypothetical protein
MADIREVTNPHDKITIDYTDVDAARLAVLYVGNGWDCNQGGEGMSILSMGAAENGAIKTYGTPLQNWADKIDAGRLATALESMQLQGERSSLSDPVGTAHEMAKKIRAFERGENHEQANS